MRVFDSRMQLRVAYQRELTFSFLCPVELIYMSSENVVTPLPKLHDKLHDPALVVMRLIIVQQNYNTLVP